MARRAWRRSEPRTLILLYHHIADVPSDPQKLCVSPKHFSEHLDVIHKRHRSLSLHQAITALQRGSLLDGSVVITFDDGYASNLHCAKPLLERFDTPATVFVTTRYVEQQQEFWWDVLDGVILAPGTLPSQLCLTVNGEQHQWELGASSQYTEQDATCHSRWDVLEESEPTPRQRLYRDLCILVRPLEVQQRQEVLANVFAWADVKPLARKSHRPLTSDEVVSMAAGGLVDIGAHTINHCVLSGLSTSRQRAEIAGGKIRLEEILGRTVHSFSYPYGSKSTFTSTTRALVQEVGFASACSTVEEVVWRGTDQFLLPRFLVRDWDGETFARKLEGWLRG